MNWMVDFYSVSLFNKINDFQLLHCDTLRNTSESACYWNQLSLNMKNGVEQMTHEGDTLGLVALLSFSLHTVQDFYSHSTWVETHPRTGTCGCYRTDTFFKYQGNLTGQPDIFSDACEMCERVENRINSTMVDHGDYCYGINKDSFVRPNHEEAFVYAFIASIEWINTTKSWSEAVNASFWNTLLDFQGVDASADWDAGYKISSWLLTGANNDGHWKGSGSGNGVRGIYKYLGWNMRPDSKLVKEVEKTKTYKLLAVPSPYQQVCKIGSNGTTIIPISEDYTKDMRVVVVRTVEIFRTNQHTLGPVIENNFTNTDSSDYWLYAHVTIGNQTFVEPTQRRVLRPYWTSMRIIKLSDLDPVEPTINITYGLFQENALFGDSPMDINMGNASAKAPGPLNMFYHVNSHMITGDVNGVFDNYDNPAIAAGFQSYVKFYITTLDLSSCGTSLFFGNITEHNPIQCPNTAVGQNGPPYVCSASGIKEANTTFRKSVVAIILPVGYFLLAIIIGLTFFCASKIRANKRRKRTPLA
eukprot:Phypoly_transcript_06451.p1 GENE.Phypoly_transcript_06451~~Phypoly_transcript_06451.p1  ORF type:complete len:583 (+),score=51.14 Phypoly_transcript_06451:166-1749(+)